VVLPLKALLVYSGLQDFVDTITGKSLMRALARSILELRRSVLETGPPCCMSQLYVAFRTKQMDSNI